MIQRPTLPLLAAAIATIVALSCSVATVQASTEDEVILHESISFADLLASDGNGATEIGSFGLLADPANKVISHTITGGYTANVVTVSGTLRADVLDGNFFFDSRIALTPSGGSTFLALTSVGGEATTLGETDTFEAIESTIFGAPNPGGGQVIQPGALELEFYEDFDEADGAVDNTFTDLSIEFYQYTAIDGEFDLGVLDSGTPYNDDTHSHATGGIDFFRFTLPTTGDVEILTAPSTNGDFGIDILDMEIGLFDSSSRLVAQNDDIDFANNNFFSGLNLLNLAAGEYTLATSTFNSSLNDTIDVGDDIGLVTAGSDFGDYELTVAFTSSDGGSLNCDFDADGDCDPTDINALYAAFGGADTAFDLSGDGAVDEADIDPWLAAASSPTNSFNMSGATFVRGDADLDGDVDSTDLGLLLNNFGDSTGMSFGSGNMNGDEFINSTDLGLLLNNFGTGAAAAAVPEPALGGWLLLCFAFGVFGRRATKS